MTEPENQNVSLQETIGGAGPISALRNLFPHVVFRRFNPIAGPAQYVADVAGDGLVEFVVAARDAGFELFVDLCGVDYLRREPRFEVVIGLLCVDPPERLRIEVAVAGTQPVLPSITGIFPGANFFERETFDLFGIEFDGHPDLSRILLPDDWQGHPLRKDYGVGSVPIQFKGAHRAT